MSILIKNDTGTKLELTKEVKDREITIDEVKHVIVEETDIEKLVLKCEQLQEEKDLIKWGVLQLLGLLGLTNDEKTKVKPEVISGEESVFKSLMKSGGELFLTFSMTNMPGKMGKKAEDKVKQQFAFVDKLLPLLQEEKPQENGNNGN